MSRPKSIQANAYMLHAFAYACLRAYSSTHTHVNTHK